MNTVHTCARARTAADTVQQIAHVGLAALAVVAAVRYAAFHGVDRRAWLVGALAALLVAVDLLLLRARHAARPARTWLLACLVAWSALVAVAPSFAWCALPLLFLSLRILPERAASLAAGALVVVSVIALLRLAHRFDPSMVAGPAIFSALVVATHRALSRETAAHARVIADLTATRDALAEHQRHAGVLAERQRLAGELHDTIAQGLSSVLLLTQAAERALDAEPETARSHLRTTVDQCRHDLAEVRRIVHALAPPALDDASLATALEDLCRRHEATTRATVTFLADGSSAAEATSPSRDAALLRIAQEALANAIRHANAGRIDVTLSYLPHSVTLDVVDDGVGFDAAAVSARSRGHGLGSMRVRAEQAGGTLAVETEPGAGTAVAATIPVQETAP